MIKILKNSPQIEGEIINLINESNCEVYIVSPYLNIFPRNGNNDENLIRAIEFAEKNTIINFVLRGDVGKEKRVQTLRQLQNLKNKNIKVYMVHNLHSKLYLNEHKVIITSMNLYTTTINRNLELGVLFDIENAIEYNQLRQFIDHLKKFFNEEKI